MSIPATAWSLAGTLTSAAVAVLAFARSEQVARRRAEDKASAIDAEAYERARTIYDSAIDQLQDQNKGLLTQVTQLQARVAVLERVMRGHGLDIPP